MFWRSEEKCLPLQRQNKTDMDNNREEVTALTFRKGEERAAIVTTGRLWIVYVNGQTRMMFQTQGRAIAHLEALGFTICMDEWT